MCCCSLWTNICMTMSSTTDRYCSKGCEFISYWSISIHQCHPLNVDRYYIAVVTAPVNDQISDSPSIKVTLSGSKLLAWLPNVVSCLPLNWVCSDHSSSSRWGCLAEISPERIWEPAVSCSRTSTWGRSWRMNIPTTRGSCRRTRMDSRNRLRLSRNYRLRYRHSNTSLSHCTNLIVRSV